MSVERVASVLAEHGWESIALVGGDVWCATCDRAIGVVKAPGAIPDAVVYAHQAEMLRAAGLLAGDDPHAGHRYARAMCPACEDSARGWGDS